MLGGAVAAAIGCVVLLGWVVHADLLEAMVPGLLPMKANTAVCFVLMGGGVAMLGRAVAGSRGRRVGLLLVAASASIAAVTLAEYVLGIDLRIDTLLFHEPPGTFAPVLPGRMSPVTAVDFVLLGIAAAIVGRAERLVAALCAIVFSVSVLVVLDFVFGAAVPPLLAPYTQIAMNTAIAMGIMAAGVVGLLGRANPFAQLVGRTPTTSLLRRLLAVTVIVPVVMAWLRLEGERLRLYDTSYGTSLMLVGILALGVIAIIRSARWANELERKRDALEFERDRFFELSLDMLSVIGADGRFRRVNGAWETVLGYPDGELIGRSFLEFLHPDDLARTTAEADRQYGQGEVSLGFQNRYRHHDGTYRWLEWMSRTSPDRSVAYGVARDVTDRKEREDRARGRSGASRIATRR